MAVISPDTLHCRGHAQMFQRRIEDERPALHNGAPSMALKNLTVCYALFQYITLGLDAACQVTRKSSRPLLCVAGSC
jgi:hypothetical protein